MTRYTALKALKALKVLKAPKALKVLEPFLDELCRRLLARELTRRAHAGARIKQAAGESAQKGVTSGAACRPPLRSCAADAWRTWSGGGVAHGSGRAQSYLRHIDRGHQRALARPTGLSALRG